MAELIELAAKFYLLAVGVYVLLALHAMREGIAWFLNALIVSGLTVFLSYKLLLEAGNTHDGSLGVGLIVGAIVWGARTAGRSRYIPADVRRKVIARDLKDKKYNSKKHHIDHTWPHSRGGSNTEDNLRVIAKKKNLKKGKKLPSFGELWD